MGQQEVRLLQELDETQVQHALTVARDTKYKLETRRILGQELPKEFDLRIELTSSFVVSGVRPDLIEATVGMTIDAYLGRIHGTA